MRAGQTEDEDDARRRLPGGDATRGAAMSRGGRTLALAAFGVFLVALGVRFFAWQDARLEYGKVQSAVTGDYKHVARLMLGGGVESFFDSSSPLANPDTLGHPPGYSALLALTFRAAGESDAAVQLVQIVCDAAGCVVLLLIVAELLRSTAAATTAGALSALSPQFAWNSVMLLPDTLAVLPVLLAVYCLARASRQTPHARSTDERSASRRSARTNERTRLLLLLAAGALVGVSCWLRANAMLLAPFLAVCVVPLLFKRGARLRPAAALAVGALAVVGVLTARNAVVFRRFVPVSLGAGQTFLEGIADYDREGRFGIPRTDYGIQTQEAEAAGRPEYRETLFGPGGVERERRRIARGLSVVRSHPFWFAGVMIRRAASMLRLERTPAVSAEPPVTRPLEIPDGARPAWAASPAELLSAGAHASPQSKIAVTADGRALRIEGDAERYGRQFASASVRVEEGADYLLSVPVKVERGRVSVGVIDPDGRMRASTVVEAREAATPQEQPTALVRVPFVSAGFGGARLVISNEDRNAVAEIGAANLYALGPASHVWTRLPRALLRLAQKFFLTAAVLPLAFAGLLLLARARKFRALVVLVAVPAYYLCAQSIVHTEYRYVLAVYHFLFALAAVALATGVSTLRRRVGRIG